MAQASVSFSQRKTLSKKKVKEEKNNEPDGICDNCAYSKWSDYFENRDLEGYPITLRCPYYYDGNIGIIRGTKGCSKYKNK